MLNRRTFLKMAGTATAATALGGKVYTLTPAESGPVAPIAANDHIQIALIGAGIQGQGDTRFAVQVPGVNRFFGSQALWPHEWAIALTAAGTATAGVVVFERLPFVANRIGARLSAIGRISGNPT